MESKTTKESCSVVSQFNSQAVAMSRQPQGRFFMAQFTLRVLAIVLTSAAMVTLILSKQSVTIIFGFVMEARYTDSSALKFIFGVDAVVWACSVLSLILVFSLSRPKSNLNNYFIVFLHDLVIALLMMAGCAAATAIGVVGRNGQNQSAWMPICDRVGKFCNKVTLSVALSFTAFLCYLVLTVMSVCKLKSLRPQQ